jgi:hypothetical protein
LSCSLADFCFLFLFCCEDGFGDGGDGKLLMSFPSCRHHFLACHLALLFQKVQKNEFFFFFPKESFFGILNLQNQKEDTFIYIYMTCEKRKLFLLNVIFKESFFGLATLQDQKMNSLEEKHEKIKIKII